MVARVVRTIVMVTGVLIGNCDFWTPTEFEPINLEFLKLAYVITLATSC